MGGSDSTHGEIRNAYISVGNLKGRDHMEDLVVDAKIILKCISGK
jgi:hypothetical protein